MKRFFIIFYSLLFAIGCSSMSTSSKNQSITQLEYYTNHTEGQPAQYLESIYTFSYSSGISKDQLNLHGEEFVNSLDGTVQIFYFPNSKENIIYGIEAAKGSVDAQKSILKAKKFVYTYNKTVAFPNYPLPEWDRKLINCQEKKTDSCYSRCDWCW